MEYWTVMQPTPVMSGELRYKGILIATLGLHGSFAVMDFLEQMLNNKGSLRDHQEGVL